MRSFESFLASSRSTICGRCSSVFSFEVKATPTMSKKSGNKRVALVTGSTSGIGRSIAQRLAQDNFTIAFHSKSSVAPGEDLAKAHPGASYTQADLAVQAQARHLITTVLSHHGRLDVLVNNAGISATIPHTSLKEASPEIWRSLYEVNVIAPWTLITEAEDALRQSSNDERPSCILNISSHAGVRPKGASIPYSAQSCSKPYDQATSTQPGSTNSRKCHCPWFGRNAHEQALDSSQKTLESAIANGPRGTT